MNTTNTDTKKGTSGHASDYARIHPAFFIAMSALFLSAAIVYYFFASSASNINTQKPNIKVSSNKLKIVAPDFTQIPQNSLGEPILRGKKYLENTIETLPKYAGAKINCTHCHLNSGTTPNAGPWVGIIHRFPQYRARSGKMDTLKDRVNDCFERSLNGRRLPDESEPMNDIIAYMSWISKDYEKGQELEGTGMPKLKMNHPPDLKNGLTVYQNKCASCHQTSGFGIVTDNTKVAFPPLWGKDSFNIGAGMARLHTAAGFVKHNMPLGQGGSLSDKDAWDVAAYFTSQDRPDFKKKAMDWPKGDKPSDSRY